MTDIRVRLAVAEDFAHVSALLTELGRPPVTEAAMQAARAVYGRHLAREGTASLVGFLSLEVREHLNYTRPQAWIPDLIVTEAARGQGAGRALLGRAFEIARGRGCDRVRLESGYARTVAHQVYLAAGMSNDGYYFTRSL